REVGLVRGQMPIAPNNSNLRFSDRQVTAIPRTNENARFFTHQQPNPVARQPFNRAGGGASSMIARDPGTPAQRAPSQPRSAPNESSGSWRRFGSPAGQSGAPPSSAPQSNGFRDNGASHQMLRNDRPSSGGWQRFGAPRDSQNSTPHYNAPNGSGQG